MKIVKLVLNLLFLPLTFISCNKDLHIDPGISQDSVISYKLKLLVPGNVVTYAMDDVNESFTSSIDVFAFEVIEGQERFAYHVSGFDLSRNADEVSFKAKVQRGVQPFRFVVLANARKEVDALGNIGKGALKANLLARIVSTVAIGEAWNATSTTDFKPIPMWGESELMSVTPSTTEISGEVSLLRALARIDVQLASNALENFILTSVSLYNSKTSGTVASLALPSPLVNNSILTYNLPEGGGVSLTAKIYTFEAGAEPIGSVDATALVIGGKYNGTSTITYYRLDFLNNGGTPLALLRNNKYIATITEVSGPGSVDEETAWKSVLVRKREPSSKMMLHSTIIPNAKD